MRRTLSWGACLALLVASPVTLALGLAEPEVRSSLDAPLRARLPLTDLGGLDPSLLKARLASAAAFDEAGIPRTTLAESVKVAIERSRGDLAVTLTTRQPVNEPYLDLLLTLEWPGGRQRREITLLLDPPGYAQMPALAPGAATPARPASSAGSVATGESSSPAEGAAASAAATPQSLRVAPGDTLSGLASRVRPAGASLEQTMLALQRANPDAFADGNVNNLRAGVTLDVPSRDAILAREPEVADRQIRDQTRQWQSEDSTSPPDTATSSGTGEANAATNEGPASQPDADDGEPSPGGSRLSVLDDRALAAGSAADAGRQPLSPAALAAALQASQSTRLAELESQLQTTRQRLNDARAQRDQLTEQVGELRTEISGLRDQLATALTTRREAPASDAGRDAPTAAPNERDAAPERGMLDWLVDNLALLGGAAIALLLGLWAWLRRREHRQASDEPPARPFSSLQGTAAGDRRSVDEPGVVPASRPVAETQAASSRQAPASASEMPPEAEAISEAEIYMAYGRYDQARERLEQSLAREPDRQDLRLELLGACVALGDRAAAEREAAELERQGDEAQRREARDLLERLVPAGAADPHAAGKADITERADDAERIDLAEADTGIAVPNGADEEALVDDTTAAADTRGIAPRSAERHDEPDEAPMDDEGEAPSATAAERSEGDTASAESVIDYEPPVLEPSDALSHEPRLAQPVVDYPEDFTGLDNPALGESASAGAAESGVDAGQGWIVEEVAFDPLDLDNERSTASASPADAERRLAQARQHLDDGESHAARALLEPLLESGDDEQAGEARALLDRHGL
ncbi:MULTISPECIES: FimV/HubP family polar landmark protein [unclassified Modicisalibacter]|uniref:FimV/HubP family polar landmark protein n=1 Tax=unclassified Modicisalibacter TaxID=2679913 RepID=UPI001CCAF8DC|nr:MULTISPECIES: FimV/HubP family polar landmark protein [unclassified Modicisalibacter]MBZ9560209.1 hypothetical protein [Modicisalibacter sp. R2A 31.J]MBZ9576117.1 hypothetical protein [Modicisalibacter sp. MOD 31.J]